MPSPASCWPPPRRWRKRAARPPVWDINLGIAAGLRPTFEGSDRYTAKPLPLVTLNWRDTISFGEGGLSAYWHRRNFRIGAGLTFDPGRDDGGNGGVFGSGDDRLKGLGKIDQSLGFRGFVDYRLGPLNFELAATKFTGGTGLLANAGVSMPLRLGRKLTVMPHVRATWADGSYNQTYFGVTPVQAAASIFPAFHAGAGLKDVRGGINVVYRLNRHWYVGADAGVIRLTGDAARSPISISDTSAQFITFIGYHF